MCYLGSATLMFLLMILHATLLKESLPEHVRAAARAANKEGGCRAACAAGNPVTAFRALGRTPLLAVTTHTPTTLSPLTSWLCPADLGCARPPKMSDLHRCRQGVGWAFFVLHVGYMGSSGLGALYTELVWGWEALQQGGERASTRPFARCSRSAAAAPHL